MSTKKETTSNRTSAIQFDPASMNVFNSLQGGIQKNLQNDMQLDPRNSSTFNLGLQTAIRGALLNSGANARAFAQNLKAGGFSGNNFNAFTASNTARLGRQTSAMRSNAFLQNFLNYDLMRRQATQTALAYRPLVTGQNENAHEVQTTSGLGTWLPQVAGMAIQGGLAMATGGASLGLSAAGKAAGAAASSGGGLFSAGNFGSWSANSPTSSFFGGNSGYYTPWYQR